MGGGGSVDNAGTIDTGPRRRVWRSPDRRRQCQQCLDGNHQAETLRHAVVRHRRAGDEPGDAHCRVGIGVDLTAGGHINNLAVFDNRCDLWRDRGGRLGVLLGGQSVRHHRQRLLPALACSVAAR